MKHYPNIEKVAPWKGHYTGYGAGHVWTIKKSTSSFGNWHARSQTDPNRQLFAFGLDDMSKQLARECDAALVRNAVPQNPEGWREVDGVQLPPITWAK